MEIKYLKNEDKEAEIKIDNLTVAEILRAYLNKDNKVNFASWNREHPSKSPVLKIGTGKGRGVEKAIDMAINAINEDADKLVKDFRKEIK